MQRKKKRKAVKSSVSSPVGVKRRGRPPKAQAPSRSAIDRATELLFRGPDQTSPLPDFRDVGLSGDLRNVSDDDPTNPRNQLQNLSSKVEMLEAMAFVLKGKYEEMSDVLREIYSLTVARNNSGVDMRR